MLATGPSMTGHVATTSKDRNHSPTVVHIPEHVATMPKVPTLCLHSADHIATG
jgi:hypothetical protein